MTPRPRGSTIQVFGEWVYKLDDADVLQGVGVTDAQRIRDLRVSEMMALGGERFLVIKRTDQATALYKIDLRGATNILGTERDELTTSPTLEQHGLTGFPSLTEAGVVPVGKSLRFIASSLDGAEPQFARKLEGLGWTQQYKLILFIDDDFGITGGRVG